MKICFVVPTLTGGGAERVAVTVLSALDGARHERTLFLFTDEGAVYLDRVAPGVRVVVARRRGRLARLAEMARFFRASRPDVVMPFLSYFVVALAVWLSGAGSRLVLNQQTPTTEFLDDPDFAWRGGWRRGLFSWATRVFFARADAVVVTSTGLADDLAGRYGVPRAKLNVLPNPVDLDMVAARVADAVEGEPGEGPIVVGAGRLAGVKNFALLIEAVAGLGAVRLWILGDGPERGRLETLARERGLGDRARFWGFQSNPWKFMARASVFALTSTYEGFGNVLVEAMACGAPVVATRSPGTTDIVDDGVNGLLVEHDRAAVAHALARAIGDGELRARLVKSARERVAEYAAPRVAARYERLFEELAA